MKKLLFGFGIALLGLTFVSQAELVMAQEADAEQTATQENKDIDCDNSFSLHKALSYAQDTQDNPNKTIIPRELPGATKSKNIGRESAIQGFTGLLQRIINGFTGIAAAIAVFFIVFNGGSIMLAAGDMEKIKKARTGIIWALLGLLLIMGSYVIAKTVISLTYSGATIEDQTQVGAGRVDPCDDKSKETTTTATPTTPTPTAVTQDPFCADKPQLPASCYAGGYGSSFDTGRGSNENQCNADVQANPEFQKMCKAVLGKDFCSIGDVQQKLAQDGHYDGLGSQCEPSNGVHNDGEYGACTIGAMEKFIESKCPAAS